MLVNKNNFADIFSLVIKDTNAFDEIAEDHPKILADFISFRDNPNCVCRSKVFKYFAEFFEKKPNFLDKYIKNKESEIITELNKIAEQRQANNYTGRIITIDNTEDAWKALSQETMSKAYRSFSVVEKNDKLVVYFL